MISPCIEPGCSKLCMGLFCIDHDLKPSVEFPRGRPWPPAGRAAQTVVATAPWRPVAVVAPVPVKPGV